MTLTSNFDIRHMMLTSGEIAAGNLYSARVRSWDRFWRTPTQPGVAELIVEQEQLTAQFVGELAAFDRLEMLADEVCRTEPASGRAALIAAQVACSTHRFAEARAFVAQATVRDAAPEAIERLVLTIDQATGKDLPSVLAARRDRAARPGNWAERVPLGALLADLGEFDEADRIYVDALRDYPDVSPFAPAWVCFQLGLLWGESVPEPHADRAAQWYQTAIDQLPCYVKARVHLAEICLDRGQVAEARALLMPVLESGDPEVPWRLSEVAEAAGDYAEANGYLLAARSGFEALLAKHPLAFADHAAEFYAGSGDDPARAHELAQLNLATRPTLRAFELAHSAALGAGDVSAAEDLLASPALNWQRASRYSNDQRSKSLFRSALFSNRRMQMPGRRSFLISCGSLVATPAFALGELSVVDAAPPSIAAATAPEQPVFNQELAFRIEGWDLPSESQINDAAPLISINSSWHAAWR
jgi:tetratricopeptide (TPR) repeat protein